MVVYQLPQQQTNRQKVQSRLGNSIQFGLKKYKNKFYNSIFTLDRVKFEELYFRFKIKEES